MKNIYYLINAQWNDNPVLVATIKLIFFIKQQFKENVKMYLPPPPFPQKCIKISYFVFDY